MTRCNKGYGECKKEKCYCIPCKDNKCEKYERCAEELAAQNKALLEAINKKLREANCLQEESAKYRLKADQLSEKADKKLREVECLLEKFEEIIRKTNILFCKAIECYKEEAEDDFDCDGYWKCR